MMVHQICYVLLHPLEICHVWGFVALTFGTHEKSFIFGVRGR